MRINNNIYCKNLIQSLVLVFAGVISFTSCEDYIDIDEYVYDKMTIDSVFISKTRTFEYINGTAEYLKNESNFIGDWYDGAKPSSPSGLATDEALQPWVDDNHPGTKLMVDAITPRNTANVNPWPDYYKGIRKANIILDRIDENDELTESELREYKGLAYFLRGYFYYELVRLYGPVPILPDTPFDTDESVENVSFERSSFDDCVEYICSDMQAAADRLPLKRELEYMFMPTSGAAMAVIARLRLYSASPLYNGNTNYADWKRTDGTPFISQSKDPNRWGKAAAAFKRIIELGMYELHTVDKIDNSRGNGTLELPETSDPNLKTNAFPGGASDIDPYLSYKNIFDGTTRPENNPELIYFCVRSEVDDPFYFPARQGGNSTYSVTQDMIDQYRMADGRQYVEATDEEKSWEPVGSGLTFSENYRLSAERAIMHDNREPRFYASIGFNHCIWPASSYTGSDNNVKNMNATYYKDGNARGDDFSYNRTGYTSRKYVHAEDYNQWEGRKKTKYYPIFRYAEVLLGYVEAMNEMHGEGVDQYTDEETGITVSYDVNQMVEYFNQIRYRAGLPGITTAEASDYEKMKELLKQEWQIEFAFENHRYFDLRRWKDAPEAYRKPVTGLDVNVKKSDREGFYRVRIWDTENSMKWVWNNKMYFFPISQSVLDRNAKLVQNPGW